MTLTVALLLSLADPGPFVLVNGTDLGLQSIVARQGSPAGTPQTLGPGRLSAGARGQVPALRGDSCVFDIQADGGGATLVWRDVNLCDVRTVTLRRRGATLWVDYD